MSIRANKLPYSTFTYAWLDNRWFVDPIRVRILLFLLRCFDKIRILRYYSVKLYQQLWEIRFLTNPSFSILANKHSASMHPGALKNGTPSFNNNSISVDSMFGGCSGIASGIRLPVSVEDFVALRRKFWGLYFSGHPPQICDPYKFWTHVLGLSLHSLHICHFRLSILGLHYRPNRRNWPQFRRAISRWRKRTIRIIPLLVVIYYPTYCSEVSDILPRPQKVDSNWWEGIYSRWLHLDHQDEIQNSTSSTPYSIRGSQSGHPENVVTSKSDL
jgi:hypothetical protein